MEIILSTKKLSKKFGEFTANDDIDIDVREGEIKAIVGENGAGKSTLMNMLYGQLEPTSGEIWLRGEQVRFGSPREAIAQGIGMVHQHFMLVPSFTVFENILLGAEIVNEKIPFLVDQKEEKRRCQALIDKYGYALDVNARVADLSVGEQQKIEILKMLYRDVNTLILDEPTSVLTPQEVDAFLLQLKDLKAKGKTIILITHKLREVMEVSDSVTVIKRGQVIGNVKTEETSEAELAQMMVGRKVLLTVQNEYKPVESQITMLKVNELTTNDVTGKTVVHGVSFNINSGEIYGIAGVEGNGQSELVKLLSGMMEATSGTVEFEDTDITNNWVDTLRKKGLGIVPEDRYAEGLCKDMTLCENSIAGATHSETFSVRGVFKQKNIREHCQNLIDRYQIRIADFHGNVSQLSGGNAQKLIIAREMEQTPRLLIASQPTRGVDIGAIEFIHRQIVDFRDQGGAVLLVSSELSEIMSLADRIGVMYKGKIVGEVDPRSTTETEIGLLMAGALPYEEATA